MTTADIISSMTLIITSITLIPLLKLFLILSITKRKNRIFYIYKLLSPDLFEDKSKINEMEEKIWNRLHESLFNIFLSASREFVIDKFIYEKNNKEWLTSLGIERLIDLLKLWIKLNKLKKKLEFIAKEISKTRILIINKNCKYDEISFNGQLKEKIRITKFEIYPINYHESFNYCKEKEEKEENKKESEKFELKIILRNTKNGIKGYLKEMKEKRFSILIWLSINNKSCSCDTKLGDHYEFVLNFDKNKWMIEKLNEPHLKFKGEKCVQSDVYLNKLKEILNSEN